MDNIRRNVTVEKFLPKVVADSPEFKALCVAENTEFTSYVWRLLNEMLINQFISTMEECGLAQWEKIFDIVQRLTDTYVDRRFRILTYLKGNRPYTDDKLDELLEELTGADGYTITRNYENYSIIVSVSLGVKSQRDAVADLMERIVPKNLLLTVTLKYNRHIDLQRYTHGYMRKWTHKNLREDVLDA